MTAKGQAARKPKPFLPWPRALHVVLKKTLPWKIILDESKRRIVRHGSIDAAFEGDGSGGWRFVRVYMRNSAKAQRRLPEETT